MPTSPLMISPGEMYSLASFSILEGPGDLSKTHEQLKVAAVVVNRLNAPNWVQEFGPTIADQIFAAGQFEIVTVYHLGRRDFDSLDRSVATLARAKPNFSTTAARAQLIAVMKSAAQPTQYGAAAREVGNATGFRGDGTSNHFSRESPYDPSDLAVRHPSSIQVRWPNGANPFRRPQDPPW